MIRNLITRIYSVADRLSYLGPLLARLTLGVVFALTGWGKLHNLDKITEFFEQLNIPAAHAQAIMVSTIEFVGGVLLILGLGTRIVSLLLIGVMAVALYTTKWGDVHEFADLNDFIGSVEFIYLVVFVWLGLQGAGRVSVDYLIRHRGSSAESRIGQAA
ncbi:MAG TPA: DoxX family protein [Kofleriaceae bacterium]|nr:DoxX family protein [Kofleriaceae bacterium]